ncbi:MAG: hypothetical protein ABIN99_02435 [Nitrosospira sp.]
MLKVGKTLRENFSGINLKPELFSLHQQQAKGQYKVGLLEILFSGALQIQNSRQAYLAGRETG